MILFSGGIRESPDEKDTTANLPPNFYIVPSFIHRVNPQIMMNIKSETTKNEMDKNRLNNY